MADYDYRKQDNEEQEKTARVYRLMAEQYRNVFLGTDAGREVFADLLKRLHFFDTETCIQETHLKNFAVETLGFMGVISDKTIPHMVADWAKMPAELPGGENGTI